MKQQLWQALIEDSSLTLSEGSIYVQVNEGRGHRVQVVEQGAGWAILGRSADAGTLADAGLRATDLWERNRHQTLVGYAVGHDGAASVTSWVPFAGATPGEFQAVVREVAAEADRLEFYCHGGDEL